MSSVLSLQGKSGTYSPVEQAERENRIIRKWIADFTAGTTDTVLLTNTAFNLPSNSIVFITQFFANINTFSDDCEFIILRCTGANGSGTTEQITPPIHLFSAAAGLGFAGSNIEFINPAVVVRYLDGFRSIVLQATAGDVTTEVTVSWAGYWEIVEI